MLRRSQIARYDSFQAARGEMSALFSPFKSDASLRSAVSRYILHRSRHLDSLHKSQQRSWVRSKVSLLLQEARHKQNYAVAEAALQVALSSPDIVDTVETTWLKDALASCTSTEELRRLDTTLRAFANPESRSALLSSSTGGRSTTGAGDARIQSALVAFLSAHDSRGALSASSSSGRPRASRSMRLSDGEAHGEDEAAHWAVAERAAGRGDWMAVSNELDRTTTTTTTATSTSQVGEPPSEEAVSHALGHFTPRATGQDLVPPDQRALNALRRLQRQREQQVIAPNPSFLRYFTRQGLVRDEAELMALFTALRDRPTKVGFRLHLSQPQGRLAQQYLLPGRAGLAPVSWLPPFTGAYTLDCGSAVPYDALLANRRLLQSLSKERVGAYQSLSSMLPVHFLSPQPGDRILDLCASPGGKTTLLYDYLVGAEAASRVPSAAEASCVVANEFVPSRAQALALRLQNWSPQIAVTNLRGESMDYLSQEGSLAFNKILVDAPCSGEGRMGREVMAWRLWHPTRALEYFARQRALLQRAVELCAPGGTVVYATCTLNPIENEAVVAAVLRVCGDSVRLVAPTPLLSAKSAEDAPHLSPGLSSWWVPSRSGGFYGTVRDAQTQAESLDPDVFAPLVENAANPAQAAREQRIAEQLRHGCHRVLPHLNPGMDGFFIAVLEKTSARGHLPSSSTAAGSRMLDAPGRRDSLYGGVSVGLDESIVESVLGHHQQQQQPTSAQATSSGATARSVLHEKGWLTLPSHHPLVHRFLSPFFAQSPGEAGRRTQGHDSAAAAAAAVARMAATLETKGLHCTWSEAEGLRVLSDPLIHTLSSLHGNTPAHSDSTSADEHHHRSPTSGALVEAGVLLVTSEGRLTEAGAGLLADLNVPCRLLRVPLTYYSILLANQRLEVHTGLDGDGDVVRQALRTTSNGLVGTPHSATPLWAAAVLNQIGPHDGNAVVVLQHDPTPAETGAVDARGNANTGRDAASSSSSLWAVPVQARHLPHSRASGVRGPVVELTLLLSAPARHRCTAMLGRVQQSGRRRSTRGSAASHAATQGAHATDATLPDAHHHGAERSVLDAPAIAPAFLHAKAAAAAEPKTTSEFVFEL